MLILLNSLWLGTLTSIIPCAFAHNIAIITYLGNKSNNLSTSLGLGLAYTLGRMLFYVLLGTILSMAITKIELTATFLQTRMNLIAGSILVLIGIVILDVWKLDLDWKFPYYERLKAKLSQASYVSALCLGMLCASVFCPISTGLFFGNLIQTKGNIYAFLAYGLGSGLPILGIALLLNLAVQKVKPIYQLMTVISQYSVTITGCVFIASGVFLIFDLL